MSDNKGFHFALLVSILVHSVFFLAVPRMPFVLGSRPPTQIKVTYYKIKAVPEKKKLARKKAEPIVRKLPRIKKDEILNPRSAAKKTEKTPVTRHSHAIEKVKERKFEAVVKEERDSQKKAAYVSYYRAVRERIRQEADRNYPRRGRIEAGEVFLSFVVASSGELLNVQVIDERSVSYPLLRDIAVNSVRGASPFSPFPRGMSQYQISFSVIISFELDR